jgi:hypothetical protein
MQRIPVWGFFVYTEIYLKESSPSSSKYTLKKGIPRFSQRNHTRLEILMMGRQQKHIIFSESLKMHLEEASGKEEYYMVLRRPQSALKDTFWEMKENY